MKFILDVMNKQLSKIYADFVNCIQSLEVKDKACKRFFDQEQYCPTNVYHIKEGKWQLLGDVRFKLNIEQSNANANANANTRSGKLRLTLMNAER